MWRETGKVKWRLQFALCSDSTFTPRSHKRLAPKETHPRHVTYPKVCSRYSTENYNLYSFTTERLTPIDYRLINITLRCRHDTVPIYLISLRIICNLQPLLTLFPSPIGVASSAFAIVRVLVCNYGNEKLELTGKIAQLSKSISFGLLQSKFVIIPHSMGTE